MNELNKYSDFDTVNANAKRLYNKEVFLSTRKNKKYMIMNDNNTFVHFGQLPYTDFTKHLDEQRRELYLKRASKIKGEWKTNIYSPNMLSIVLLWT
jgi:hypothetical protein